MMKVWYIVVNKDWLIKQNPNPSMGQWMSSFEASGKAFLGWKSTAVKMKIYFI